MSRIAVFGGAFDPPHCGHLAVTRYLLDQHLADEVWLVPTGQHPFQKHSIRSDHRVAMLALIQQELGSQVRVEDYEVKRTTPSYSYHTLQALHLQYPAHDFTWVIGSDNVASFPSWSAWTELLAEFGVWVYPRQGYSVTDLPAGMTFLRQAPVVTISSTQIREAVKADQDITQLVIPAVAQYIQQQQLYV